MIYFLLLQKDILIKILKVKKVQLKPHALWTISRPILTILIPILTFIISIHPKTIIQFPLSGWA